MIQLSSGENPLFTNNTRHSSAKLRLLMLGSFRMYALVLSSSDVLTLVAQYPGCHSNRPLPKFLLHHFDDPP